MPRGKFLSGKWILGDSILGVALLTSAALHLIPIFGLSFVEPSAPSTPSAEVVQVTMSQQSRSEDADFLAQNNQQGSGTTNQAKETSSDTPASQGLDEQLSADVENAPPEQQSAEEFLQQYLSTTLSITKQLEADSDDPTLDEGDGQATEPQRIMAQVAQLEKKYAIVNQALAKKQKTRFLTSQMATKSDPSSKFMLAFTDRVERVGNEHLPQLAKEQGITGEVRLMVIVAKDGQVIAIRLLKSSGSRLLDRYAKQTVRYAAPFESFTAGMDAEELRIIRTWRFVSGATPLSVEADPT